MRLDDLKWEPWELGSWDTAYIPGTKFFRIFRHATREDDYTIYEMLSYQQRNFKYDGKSWTELDFITAQCVVLEFLSEVKSTTGAPHERPQASSLEALHTSED
jgi:hypothetical protein